MARRPKKASGSDDSRPESAPNTSPDGKSSGEKPKAEGRQAGGKFGPGNQVGKLGGRPKGSANLVNRMLRERAAGFMDEICDLLERKIKKGDVNAARTYLQFVAAPPKDDPVEFDLTGIDLGTAAGLIEASNRVLAAVSEGKLTPSQGDAIARMIDQSRKQISESAVAHLLEQIFDRLSQLESEDRKSVV